MLIWVMLLHTETSAVPVGYFTGKDECISGAKEAVMVISDTVNPGGQLFTCVPVQGLLNK